MREPRAVGRGRSRSLPTVGDRPLRGLRDRVLAQPGEEIEGYTFDEAWIYNCLQHVRDPKLVIDRAAELAGQVRIFEWIDIETYPGHPQMLTATGLDTWIGDEGFVTTLNENGAVGRAYYGVFRTS